MYFCPKCNYSFDISKASGEELEENRKKLTEPDSAIKRLKAGKNLSDYIAEFSKEELESNKYYKKLEDDDKDKLEVLFTKQTLGGIMFKCNNCNYKNVIKETIKLYQLNIDSTYSVYRSMDDNKMLFIRYEDLMDNPVDEMTRIYEYLGIPYYEGHDFENISQLTHEDDRVHGIFGDHQLRPKFERKPDDYMEVLGYEISMNIKNHYKWFYDYFGYV